MWIQVKFLFGSGSSPPLQLSDNMQVSIGLIGGIINQSESRKL